MITEPKTLEDRIAHWLTQPGTVVTAAEWQFVKDMREAAAAGVGYGWMQQTIEWEWQSRGIGALGPEYFERRIAELESALRAKMDPPHA